MESRWITLGYGTYDLSENNLKNCHLFDWGPCEGGNFHLSSAYMSRRAGPISETADPYSESPQACTTGLTPVAYETSACYLPDDPATIKQILYDNGAIHTAFYWNASYYNASDYTYYFDGAENTNHAVTIAGWDDTKVTAGGTGAWLIKNSWGSSWGNSGYFYISYNDSRILTDNGYFPTRMVYSANSKIYNYDDFGMFASFGYGTSIAYGLVKFVASNNYPVTKIGTWINGSNATFDIEVYDNFSGSVLSGLLGSLTGQTSTFPGYYTFDLPASIPMTTSNDFYVKIKYTTPSFNYPVPIEMVSTGYATNVTIQTGVCWLSSDGTSWTPIGGGTSYPYDLCIKAYAVQSSGNLPPVADFTVNNVSPYLNQAIIFTDQSTNTPTSWNWSFSPSTGTYATGYTSASQNPHVYFSAPGQYSVTLQATNANGTGSLTKTNYITVSYSPLTGWVVQASGFPAASRGIHDIYIVNQDVVWATAYDGTDPFAACSDFTRTTNGGTLWVAGSVTNTTGLNNSNICAIDANTAWASYYLVSGTNPQGIFKTVNGGATWSRQPTASFSNAASFPDFVHFWNSNEGVCVGDPINGEFEIYITTNGGTNWSQVSGSNIPNPISGEFGIMDFYDVYGNTVWFGTNLSRVYKSTDKGLTWSLSTVTPLPNKYVRPQFANALKGLVQDQSSGTTGLLAETTDGGSAWSSVSFTGNSLTSGLSNVPGTECTYVTTGADVVNNRSGVTYSFDGGHTWNEMTSTPGTQFLATDWLNDSTGWAGGFNTDATTDGMFKFVGCLMPPLLVPENLQASVNMGNVHLSWNAPPGAAGLSGYNVYRNGVMINPTLVTILSYNDINLPLGTYSYMVKAVYGYHLSPSSSPVEATIVQTTARNKVIVEIGMGTWVSYCPGAQMGTSDLVANGCQVAVIQYHNSDIFANASATARNNYYSITGFPTAMFDGLLSYVGGNHSASLYPQYLPLYQQRYAVASPLSIDIAGSSSGNAYNLVLTVHKLSTITSTSLKLQVALTETNIPYNWQGQTHVDNVERLMVPDANGTTVSFASGDTQIITLSFTKDETWVTGNCEVVAFVQDNTTKEILNGSSVLLPQLVPYPVPNGRTGVTRYDGQTNASPQNRIYLYPDGTIGSTFIFGMVETSFTDRGTGYSYFNGGSWSSFPTARIETIRTGWPSYAPLGASGEMVLSHTGSNLNISKRTAKGTGSWIHTTLSPPAGASGVLWPRMITSGTGHDRVHVLAVTTPIASGGTLYQGLDGALVYNRSLDGGATWSGWQLLQGMTATQYYGFMADTYSWAEPKGDTICFTAGENWHDQFLMKSTDNGTTWTKTVIWPCAYNTYYLSSGVPVDAFYCSDGSAAVALDNAGKAHVIFGRSQAISDGTYKSYFPRTSGLIYWNEDKPQLPQSLDSATLVSAGAWLAGTQDPMVWYSTATLPNYGTSMTTMPNLVIDNSNRLFAVWCGVTSLTDPNGSLLRHIYARASVADGNSWCDNIVDLTGTGYTGKECVFPSMAARSNDNLFLTFQTDSLGGSWARGSQNLVDNNYIQFVTVPKNDLLCTGNAPPSNLVAGNNFQTIIPLNWQYPSDKSGGKADQGNMQGSANEQQSPSIVPDYYKIYRRTGTSGNFSQVGSTLNYINFNPPTCFTDAGRSKGIAYYYKATAVINGAETGFSNIVSGICDTVGFSATAVNTMNIPVLDGIINDMEWSDATQVNITNSLGVFNAPPSQPVYAYVKKSGNFLYIALKDLSDVTDDLDEMGFYFDNDADHVFDDTDGNLWIDKQEDNSVRIRYRQISGTFPYNLTFAATLLNPAGVTAAMGMNSGHREYEVRIDLLASPVQPLNNALGCYFFTWDQTANIFNGYWPDGHIWPDPLTYGELNLPPAIFNAPVTTAGIRGVPHNSMVSIPVTVTGFTAITALSLRLEYDPTVLTYTGYANANSQLTGLMVNDVHISASLHKVMMTWTDVSPQTLSSQSKLLDLVFTYGTGTSALYWNNDANSGTDCEYADVSGNPMNDIPSNTYYINGEVHYQPGYKVSGNYQYNNAGQTALDNIKVVLKQGNTRMDSVLTNTSGYFEFNGVLNNTYTLKASSGKAWLGVNGTDALKIQRHFVGLELLTEPVKILAGDANNSNSINGTDAVKVKMRFVGMETSFLRGDWAFAKQVTGGDTVIVNGGDVSQNFYGLCVGDVNGSNVPGPGKAERNTIELIRDGLVELVAGQTADIPVRIMNSARVGAVSLILTYPDDLITIEDVIMNRKGMIYNASGSQLRIVWSELEPMDFAERDVLLTLRIRAAGMLASSSGGFISESGSELADAFGNPVPFVVLSAPELLFVQENEITGAMVSIYPNPAIGVVHIEYDLIENSDVHIRILSVEGREVLNTVFADQQPGKAKQHLDLHGVANGVYLVEADVIGRSSHESKVLKLVIRN